MTHYTELFWNAASGFYEVCATHPVEAGRLFRRQSLDEAVRELSFWAKVSATAAQSKEERESNAE